MRGHRVLLGMTALVLGAALAACGGDSDGGGDAGGDAVSVDAWAGGVCTAVGTWVNEIGAGNTAFQGAIADDADPAAAKAQLETFADDVLAETDTMLAGVQAAGVPDIDDGEQLSSELNAGLAGIKPVFEELKTGIAALPTDNSAAFVAGAEALVTSLNQGVETFGTTFDEVSTKYQSDELSQAFADNEACTAIGG